MEAQEGIDREINLIELFWQILLRWRQMICLGIIFAILFAGMRYIRDVKSYQAAQNTNTGEKVEKLSEDEMQEVTAAKTLITRIEEYESYLETSVLMQINPYKKPVVELQYYVDSDYTFNYTQESQSDYTQDLMSLYYNYIASGKMSHNLIKEANLSVGQADISELLTVSVSGSTIFIKIVCTDVKEMDAVAESIKNQLSEKEIELQKVGIHELKLLGESKNEIVDNNLIDRKGVISNTISTLNTQLNMLKTNMSELQLDLLNSEIEEVEDVKETGVVPGFNYKYVILGIAFGIFLVCAGVACKMVFSARLQNPEEVRNQYGVYLLGEVSVQSRKKQFLSIIDDGILAIKNRRKKKLPIEQQIKIVSAKIALSCKQHGIDCIYMTGSEYENVDETILDTFKQELAVHEIQVKEGGNIFYNSESLKLGTEIGNIIFIEQVGKSFYDEISNELNLAKEQRNYILGVVVLV